MASRPRPLPRRALLALLVAPACGRPGAAPGDPEELAARFLDLYLVEADQQRSMELTAGLAHELLEREYEEVRQLRAEGASTTRPGGIRPRFFLEERRDNGPDAIQLLYRIELEPVEKGTDGFQRSMILSLQRLDAGWRVTNYSFHDES